MELLKDTHVIDFANFVSQRANRKRVIIEDYFENKESEDYSKNIKDSVVIIFDGIECAILKPKQPVAQKTTISNYKNRNTVKALVSSTSGEMKWILV